MKLALTMVLSIKGNKFIPAHDNLSASDDPAPASDSDCCMSVAAAESDHYINKRDTIQKASEVCKPLSDCRAFVVEMSELCAKEK
jgi:hypothetical protein